MIAADPFQGGATWAVLQFLLGLRRLGHEVYFVEPLSEKALRPVGGSLPESQNAAYFQSVVDEFGLGTRAALLLDGTEQTVGLSYADLREIAKRADLLINVSGMLTDPALLEPIALRVYLDLDPAFNQLWSAVYQIDMRFAAHTHFVTVGQAIGTPDCPVPTCGLDWLPTFQPIVLDEWPVANGSRRGALTTVGNWRGYGSVEYDGKFYGQKAHSLRRFFPLPEMTDERFELALAIHPGETPDVEALARHRWTIRDPSELTGTPASYRRFIQQSKAEFGIAKSGYVVSQSGWFSDRSVCYLASGKPVLAQDTGFGRFLPTGEGLFAFDDSAGVLTAIEEMNRDYSRHARAARALAEEFFDSDKVLPRLVELVHGTL
ncbi:MAG: hypothetical protein QOE70_1286 [Chthoniobacter sp.]|nr:hypothetical protein [Chthoniobacter sp.]